MEIDDQHLTFSACILMGSNFGLVTGAELLGSSGLIPGVEIDDLVMIHSRRTSWGWGLDTCADFQSYFIQFDLKETDSCQTWTTLINTLGSGLS